MARSHKRYDRNTKLILEEIYRSDVLEYVHVYYRTMDGDPDDPATQIELRTAIFKADEAPADLQDSYNAWQKASNSWGYFEGLPKAVVDEVVEVTKEYDYEAEQLRKEEERLVTPTRRYNYKTGQYEQEAVAEYVQFWEAVERYAEDPDDEDAWSGITKWRNRQLRQEERV